MNYTSMFFETLFGFAALFLLTKVLGKTQISQLTPFDFIAALVLGELVGNALFDEKAGIMAIGFVIVLWGGLLFIVEIITQKFKGSRNLLEGKPSFVIHKGKLIYEELRKNKIDIGELQHMLRMKDVFAIQEVEYAIMEPNGQVSVLKKSDFQTPTKQDLNIQPTVPQVAMTLISDGEMIKDNLAESDLTEQWLLNEVRAQGLQSVKEVFYAEWKQGQRLFVLPYTKIKNKDMAAKHN
ncbi:DUF421 domain-containing protein [Virgibacillus sp. W0181]|uniref:DUF421 domain-containing protein n=1 Tax=Virgibacillus sp. W0181 TaxID=3391581 RepID=UPI003F475328